MTGAFFAQWTADERFYRHELVISGDLAYSRFGTELTFTSTLVFVMPAESGIATR